MTAWLEQSLGPAVTKQQQQQRSTSHQTAPSPPPPLVTQLRRLLLLRTHLGGALRSGVVAEQEAALLRGGFWDWVAREEERGEIEFDRKR